MKSFVTLMLCLLSMTTFAQVHDEISSAMEEFDYDKVINLIPLAQRIRYCYRLGYRL